MERTEILTSIRRAQEVARAASHLAYEAASLAQMFDTRPQGEAALAAAQASIQAARRAFQLEDEAHATPPRLDVADALRMSREALDDATEAVRAAREAIDAALATHARPRQQGGEGAGAG